MDLRQTTLAVRRQAGCEVFGCRLELRVIEYSLSIKHYVNGSLYDHSLRFDQTQFMWEIVAIGEVVVMLKKDHVS